MDPTFVLEPSPDGRNRAPRRGWGTKVGDNAKEAGPDGPASFSQSDRHLNTTVLLETNLVTTALLYVGVSC